MVHREVAFKLAVFMQKYPPRELNQMIRNMILDYFINHRDGLNHRLDRQFLVDSMWDLMQFLDVAEIYWEYRDIDGLYNAHKKRR